MKNQLKNIIETIKQAKSDKKLTNLELSSLSGVPYGTVNKILSGATKSVKNETLSKLLNALSIDDETNIEALSVNTYGFVKVGAYTPEIKLSNPSANADLIIKAIIDSDGLGVSLLAFPELCLTGCTLGDLYYQVSLLKSSQDALSKIVYETKNTNVVSVIGMPYFCDGKLYSVGAVVYGGKILGLCPNNTRGGAFASFYGNKVVNFLNQAVPFGEVYFKTQINNGLSFCVQFSSDLYAYNTLSEKLHGKINAVVCLSSLCETVGKSEHVETALSMLSKKLSVGYVYAEAGYGESTTDCVFSASNYLYESGKLLQKSKKFTSGVIVSEFDIEFLACESLKNRSAFIKEIDCCLVEFNQAVNSFSLTRSYDKMPFVPKTASKMQSRAELILDIQANALKRRIEHVNAKKLVIGVSGGLDSTLALIVAVRALNLLKRSADDIVAVTMPCFGTTDRTKSNAYDLCKGYGIPLKEISIKKAVTQHFEDIGHDGTTTDVTFENSQARERTQVLMDLANKENGLVVGTGDLSELALGWATYNGDHMSNYAVNASVPKTLIRYLVSHEAQKSKTFLKDVLNDILDTPVSPELVPPEKSGKIAQKTEDIVGPYLLHDFYLYHAVRRCSSPSKIFYIAKKTFKNEFDSQTLYKWLKNFYNRFFNQQFKRSCLPDGVKVGSVSLSPRGDYSMPSDAYKWEWLSDLEKIKL